MRQRIVGEPSNKPFPRKNPSVFKRRLSHRTTCRSRNQFPQNKYKSPADSLSAGQSIIPHLLESDISSLKDRSRRPSPPMPAWTFVQLGQITSWTEEIPYPPFPRILHGVTALYPSRMTVCFSTIAVADPLDFETLDSLPHVIGRELTPRLAQLRQRYRMHTYRTALFHRRRFGRLLAESLFSVSTGDAEAGTDTGDAPIIRLVQQMLTEAFRLRASDIHIEPLETSVRIRYRMDGKLVHVDTHPKKLLPAIIARLKVMSGSMSIAEKRLPQDGRIQLKMGEKEVDLRVSSVPSNHGEVHRHAYSR